MLFVKRFCFLLLIGFLTSCTHHISSVVVDGRMVLIAPNVFVDRTMSVRQQQQFLYNLSIARQKVQRFFGSIQANPVIYACITPACTRLFAGLGTHVDARATAYDDSHIVLTARALDHITISHELTHIELHKRIGNKQAWYRIPFWFDEGLAVLVGGDPRYDEQQWYRIMGGNTNTVALNNLVTEQQWVYAVRQGQWPYGIARKAVQDWYNANGHQALEALILRMRQGQPFTL